MQPTHYTYQVGTTTLAVVDDTGQTHTPVDALWQMLFQMSVVAATRPAQIHLHWVDCAGASYNPTLVELFRYDKIHLWQGQACFVLTCGTSRLHIDLAQSCASGWLTDDFWQISLAEQREFFQLLFILLLRRQGCYVLHANALLPPRKYKQVDPELGLLLVGDCGAGKTTLTLSLLQAGWRCVGDDLIILSAAPNAPAGSVLAHGLRRGFSCTAQTVAAFPTLQPFVAEGVDLLRNKKFLQVDRCYPEQFFTYCQPRLLLFPSIAQRPVSQLAALTATEAMTQLLSQPRAGILLDPPTIAGHLQLYAALLRQVESHHIYSGEDVLMQPEQVSQQLVVFMEKRQ